MMRLTSREKFMILGLCITLLLTGTVYYFYLPVYDSLQSEKKTLIENKNTLQYIENNILPIEQQLMLIENFRDKVDLMQKTLPPRIYQEEVIRNISEVMERNFVDVSEYSFGSEAMVKKDDSDEVAIDQILAGYEDTVLDSFSKNMVEARFENASNTDENEKEGWEEIVSSIDVTLILIGEYENIKRAINDFENSPNLILLTDMSLFKVPSDENVVKGSVKLKFPYYYDNETLEKLDWAYYSEFEKHKPFDYIITGSSADPNRPIEIQSRVSSQDSGLSVLESVINSSGNADLPGLYDREAEASKQLDSDFEIVMSAPTSINMDYIITKGNERELSLMSQRENETLNLTVTESAGRYAFNYSNTFQDFPDENEYYAFVPNYDDAIYVSVVSSPRVNLKDIGMGILNVYNKTSKPLKIIVSTDDETLPRLVMGSQEGDISIIHE